MIRVNTHHLVGLLTDLALTAANPDTGAPTASVLLHTTRGYTGDQPGQTDLLVGTSTDGFSLGHSHTPCAGQVPPMLWPIGDVRAVLAVLKPLAKDRDHAVEVGPEDGKIAVAEDPDLFGERLKLTFSGLDLADYPVDGARQLLTEVRVTPAADGDTPAPGAAPRTDFVAGQLTPFLAIAKRRGLMLEMFRYHQRLPIVVQIGPEYRGVLRPYRWQDEDRGAGVAPGGDVYPLVLE